MKIKKEKFAGLSFPDWFRASASSEKIKQIKEMNITEERKERLITAVDDIVSDSKNKNYLISTTSYDLIDKIKIDVEKSDCTFFSGLELGKKITVLVDEDNFFRYLSTEDGILCLIGIREIIKSDLPFNYKMQEGHELTDEENNHDKVIFTRSYIFLNTKNGSIENGADFSQSAEIKEFSHDDEIIKLLKIILFLEFSDIDTVLLKEGDKIGTRRQGKYLNESGKDVILVDSTWNKTIIRLGGFGVRGHIRLQAFGPGRTRRKLIYIPEYTKKGYVRNAKKQIVNG